MSAGPSEPLRERIRDRRTGRTHEILARDAEIATSAVLREGAKVVVIREMLTARVRVILVGEISGGHFEPVDPGEPVERSRLHVVPKPEEGH
ncbi:hypothetical protein [Methylorubrum rhodesianum]|uniref:hypothetical protein n=1 Tax=Methylorubrum rhodesianum TaxID=29427 RepID=UPI00374578A9